MAKKSAAKKRPARKPHAPRTTKIGTMKGGVIVQGSIRANRDVIMGNQYNDYRQQIAQIATPEQFIAEAEKVQQQIAEAKKLPDLLPAQTRKVQTAEDDLKDAITEAKKSAPSPKTMSDNLKSAAETLDGIGKTVQAAQGMGKKIDDLARSIDWGKLAVGASALADLAVRVFGSLPR